MLVTVGVFTCIFEQRFIHSCQMRFAFGAHIDPRRREVRPKQLSHPVSGYGLPRLGP